MCERNSEYELLLKLLVYDQGYRHYPDTALPMISMVKRRERKRRARERKSTPQKTSSQAHPESIRLFTDRWRDILPISRRVLPIREDVGQVLDLCVRG